MPLFTKNTLIAALLAIPVFGTAIIAANYPSAILTHLVDIINGDNTQTVVSLNAPNWSSGIPLATPVGISAATSTGGTMASSTPVYFAVAALDGTGTTTISNVLSATTDASSTVLAAEGFNVSWSAVQGATGYAVYIGSSASNLTSYFLATSTNGTPNRTIYIASTTANALTGSNTLADTTAFSVKINPLGTSFFNGGKIGVGTSSPLANLDVASGTVRAIGASTSTCNSTNAGAIQFQSTSGHFYGCLSSGTWKQLDN